MEKKELTFLFDDIQSYFQTIAKTRAIQISLEKKFKKRFCTPGKP
ncbi:hypothetical protein ACEU2D_20125 [Brevibacillus laterosporus]